MKLTLNKTFVFASCFLFLFSVQAKAQEKRIDSLKTILTKAKEDTNKVKTLITLALALEGSKPDQAFTYANEALLLSQSLDFKRGTSICYHTMGSLKFDQGDYDKALDYLFKDITIAQQIGDRQGVGTTFNTIGNIHAQHGDYDKALEFYFKSLKIKEDLNDKKGMAACYGNIGIINYLKNDYPKALEYYTKALEIFTELGFKESMADSYNNIGLIYASQGDYSKALEFYFKDLAITEALGDKQAIADSYGNIGQIQAKKGNFADALEYYMKSLNIRKELGDKKGMADSYSSLGNLYMQENHYAEAKVQLLRSLEISIEIDAKPDMMSAYLALSACDSSAGNFKSAYDFHKLYSQYKDSVINEDSNAKIDELQTKYKSEKNTQEIEFLNKDKEHQAQLTTAEAKKNRTILIFVICGFAGALIFAFIIFRGYKQKQKVNFQLADKNKIIEEKNKDITDSINYARRIQDAMLVPKEEISKTLKDFFILLKPKDIVSGDFYYYAETNNKIIIAAVDCTGHGVPGAFMSLIGNDALNDIVIGRGITTPSLILEKLHDGIRLALKQETLKSESRDGMDIAICSLDLKTNTLEFSGAMRNLYIIRNKEEILEEIIGNKTSVGGEMSGSKKIFANNVVQIFSEDAFYIFSDGFADQFGGQHGKKFMVARLKGLLLANSKKKMIEQETELFNAFEDWRRKEEQIDDILVIGVRV